MRIACLGDSCTYGQNVRADQAWPHLLWQMTGHDVRNLGVNGDTTRLGLERWHRDVDLMNPDVVVVQFGHNDAHMWDDRPRVSLNAYQANLREMSTRAPKVIILAPHPATIERTPGYNARLEWYADAADGRQLDITVLDDGYGVHPDPDGHLAYAHYVESQL